MTCAWGSGIWPLGCWGLRPVGSTGRGMVIFVAFRMVCLLSRDEGGVWASKFRSWKNDSGFGEPASLDHAPCLSLAV